MVWVVRYEDIAGGDRTITLWDDLDSARKDVCSCIIDDINNNGWDFNDQEAYNAAKRIQDEVNNLNYEQAIEIWNDYSSSSGSDIYWTIYHEDVCDSSMVSSIGTVIFPTPVQQVPPVVPDPPATQPSPFVPTTSGATCRGHCRQWNEYAYADRADGTYVCTQCKTFGQLFGTKTP